MTASAAAFWNDCRCKTVRRPMVLCGKNDPFRMGRGRFSLSNNPGFRQAETGVV